MRALYQRIVFYAMHEPQIANVTSLMFAVHGNNEKNDRGGHHNCGRKRRLPGCYGGSVNLCDI
jgi:hypothetical protein